MFMKLLGVVGLAKVATRTKWLVLDQDLDPGPVSPIFNIGDIFRHTFVGIICTKAADRCWWNYGERKTFKHVTIGTDQILHPTSGSWTIVQCSQIAREWHFSSFLADPDHASGSTPGSRSRITQLLFKIARYAFRCWRKFGLYEYFLVLPDFYLFCNASLKSPCRPTRLD